MKEFFKVVDLDEVISKTEKFLHKDKENISIDDACDRILAENIKSDENLPGFTRSTMDGFAIKAKSSFGASSSNPALIEIIGNIKMGETPDFSIGSLEAAKISTGGMLPEGADAVAMVEDTDEVDDSTIEVFKSVAPFQNIVLFDDDFKKDEVILEKGTILRPQEIGLLAAFGYSVIPVYKKPVVGIISTGDEVVSIDEDVSPGKIRDINSYSIRSIVLKCGCIGINYGIVKDNYDDLKNICEKALKETDILLMSGGSSVGTRDFTIEVLSSMANSEILVHGISLSPGKPTILADIDGKPVFGLPGHVVSAMVVMKVVVEPFIDRLKGISERSVEKTSTAVLSRNVASVTGRTDFIRVKTNIEDCKFIATPVLGKSSLINTVIKADGLVKIDKNTEGLYKGAKVNVIPL
ncbi:MAG: molybdopterin molybdotransferase MoeA [Deltaproteobacteria bacterium]|nr:molybdopterin molybdotransferase MoeA [Deltaproteobacteria bacterium]